jgi:hypothetical protein
LAAIRTAGETDRGLPSEASEAQADGLLVPYAPSCGYFAHASSSHFFGGRFLRRGFPAALFMSDCIRMSCQLPHFDTECGFPIGTFASDRFLARRLLLVRRTDTFQRRLATQDKIVVRSLHYGANPRRGYCIGQLGDLRETDVKASPDIRESFVEELT